MPLPKITQDRINQQAEYYSGFNENEDHTPISKGKYYGYIAGATAENKWAQKLVDALRIAKEALGWYDDDHPADVNSGKYEAIRAIDNALQQWNEKNENNSQP